MVSAQRVMAFLLTCFGFLPLASAHPNAYAGYRISVEDVSGRELPTFLHGGQTFVLGSYGERYNIRVRNQTGRRVEAVVTVDGRDVVSGRMGDFVNERGYLIDAYDSVLVEGFRQSFSQVAAFRFVTPDASYSSRMGTPQNVGVIGVALFPERERPQARIAPQASAPARRPYDYDLEGRAEASADRRAKGAAEAEARSSSPSAGSGYAASPPAPSTDNLGTEYGESMASSAQEVPFRRADSRHPAAILNLRYDDRDGLIARGIAIEPPYRPYRPYYGSAPEAFPQNRRFAPPPSGW